MDEGIKRHRLDYGQPLFIPGLPTTTVRCVGQGYYLSQRERDSLVMHHAFLVRDRRNPVDPLAVAVIRDDMRKVGYISAAKAKQFAPLLEHLDSLQVDCTVDGSRLWLQLPSVPSLRREIKQLPNS